MNPEQEADLFTALGRIEAKLDATNANLAAHTLQDAANFAIIDVDLNELKLNAARAAGAAEEAARHSSVTGSKWGAAAGTAVSVVISGFAAYLGK